MEGRARQIGIMRLHRGCNCITVQFRAFVPIFKMLRNFIFIRYWRQRGCLILKCTAGVSSCKDSEHGGQG